MQIKVTALAAALAAVPCSAFVPSSGAALVPRARLQHVGVALRRGVAVSQQRRHQCFAMKVSNDFDDSETGPAQISAGGINVSGEAPFEIRGFSLGNAFLIGGVVITTASFAEYFTSGGAGLSGLGFVYGIPVALIGLALKYAELAPVGVSSTPAAAALFEEKATETMRKIKKDVTRHRYGDEAHLDSTVKALGLVLPQSDYPQLQGLKEEVAPNGELAFSMIFSSPETPFKMWVDPARVRKYTTFFGPGVTASVEKVSSEARLVAIKLTTVNPDAPTEEPSAAAAAAVPVPEEEKA
ncbi:hypothetical protein JKP88DRAFT_183812 [Tribonema minus]|uniref:Uncharacterized protein n=1 Tax=Tribonema minus TaxID=303371 RepID=A0A835YHW7_9STRA|nr:hypothetical protein JKP88DRAFT_183812 [Tribonema minus]